ncbi:MAG: hypothetical protein ACTTIO_05720 [Candidatus Fimenecus sp.]
MKKNIFALFIVFALIFANISFAFADGDPSVTLVNPISNSVGTSPNLLISAKLEGAQTIRVSVYEVKKNIPNPAFKEANKNTVPQYLTQSLGDAEMKTIMDGKFDWKGKVAVSLLSENFTSNKKLSFYTKKLEKINTGIYLVKIETISGDKVIYTTQSYTQIKEKQDDKLFSENQTGAGSILQGLVKSVFGN